MVAESLKVFKRRVVQLLWVIRVYEYVLLDYYLLLFAVSVNSHH